MRAHRFAAVLALAVSAWLAGHAPALAIEKVRITRTPPPASETAPEAPAAAPEAPPLPAAPVAERHLWRLGTDDGYFLPPLADINAPVNYMRFYYSPSVAFTTTTNVHDNDFFWDVGFGEQFFVFSRRNKVRSDGGDSAPSDDLRWKTGYALFIDADVHMLLDFLATSSPVIDSEFRLGGGLMGRGLPYLTQPGAPASHVAWRVKLLHESTHIGDEYLDNVRNRQAGAMMTGATPPPMGFRHPNVSYMALEFMLAIDAEFAAGKPSTPKLAARNRGDLYLRGYAGYRRLLSGPYTLPAGGLEYPNFVSDGVITVQGSRNEGQLGGEARLRMSSLEETGWRWFDYLIFAGEVFLRREYDYDGSKADRKLMSLNLLAGVEWGDWIDDQMTFRFTANFYDGINPHGQFRAEALTYGGLTMMIDY